MVPWPSFGGRRSPRGELKALNHLAKTIALAAVLVAGCGDVGTVVFDVEAPSAPELDPRTGTSTLELSSERPGQPPVVARVTLAGRMGDLSLGDVPLGPAVSFQLRGFSEANQVVAYGKAGPVTVEGAGETHVTIPVRRPFAYVAAKFFSPMNTGAVKLYDTGNVLGAMTPEVTMPGVFPVGVALSDDGRTLLMSAASPTIGQAVVVDTLTHMQRGMVTLTAVPGAVALTPNAKLGAAVHTDANRVSLLDIDQVRTTPAEPAGAVRVVDNVRQPGAVAAANDRVFVLAGRPATMRCGGTPAPPRSAIVEIDLISGMAAPERDLGFAARDLALDPLGNRVLVTDTCGNKVMALAPGGTPERLLDIPGPRALSVWKRRLVVAGGTSTQPATAQLAVADLDAPNTPPMLFTLKMPDERIEIPLQNIPGQSVEIRVAPDLVEPLDVALSLDGARAVVLVHSLHRQEAITLIAEASTIDSFYLMLIDVQTGSVLSRVRTDCTARVDGDSRLYLCGEAADSLEPVSSFVPSSAAILWGAP